MVSQLYYFTIPAPDGDKAATFFGALFGWTVDGGHISNANPAGGIAPGAAGDPATLYFAVDDVAASAARVRELRGTAGDVQEGSSGWWADCRDDQGTPFSIGKLRPAYVETSAVPYLCAHDAAAALAFYASAFGAVETLRMTDERGVIGHAEFTIGTGRFFISDEWPEFGAVSPRTLGGAGCGFVLNTPLPEPLFAAAIAAGATVDRPLEPQFDGRLAGWLRDPFGFRWNVSSAGDLPKEALAEAAGTGYTVS